jgi:glucose/arabinose dehydrogenase
MMAIKSLLLPAFLGMTLGCQSYTVTKKRTELNSEWHPTEQVDYVNFESRFPSASSTYQTSGHCNGLPKINVSTAPGFCVGLVDAGEGMLFPRGLLALSPTQILVLDMGGWNPDKGRLYLLHRNGNSFQRKTLLDAAKLSSSEKKLLDRPHGIALGPDKKIWIASATTVYTMDPLAADPLKTIEIKLDSLPAEGLHPLKSFVFDDQNHFYLNLGATTNNCQSSGYPMQNPPKHCAEGDHVGLVRRYNLRADGSLAPQFQIFASGLRNSVAMVWSPDLHSLIQGENSRDAINKANPSLSDSALPADEINLLQDGRHYGWPYCYNDSLNSPEFPGFDCSKSEKPVLLLPAHSAPLSFLLYDGLLFPKWYKGRLLAALHGYRETGHRIVSFLRNEQGLPTGRPLSIVFNWEAKGTQAMGSPVSLTMASDGSVFISEDKNKKVLQLFYEGPADGGKPVDEGRNSKPNVPVPPKGGPDLEKEFKERLNSPNPPLFTLIQEKMIHQNCIQCHGGPSFPSIQMIQYDDRGTAKKFLAARSGQSPLVVPGNANNSELYQRVMGLNGQPQMPPMGFPSAQEQQKFGQMLKQWIDSGAPLP